MKRVSFVFQRKQLLDPVQLPDWTRSQSASITMSLRLPERDLNPRGLEGDCECLFCDETFKVPANEKQLLTHLFQAHQFVVSSVNFPEVQQRTRVILLDI